MLVYFLTKNTARVLMYTLNGIFLLNNWQASYNKNNESYVTKQLPSQDVQIKTKNFWGSTQIY